MRRILIGLLIVGGLGGAVSVGGVIQDDPCATGEQPCDPNRPWWRGMIEKSCAPQHVLDALRRESPNKIILECECKHACDPTNPYAGETKNRKWDARCEARCNPDGCKCKHPCEQT